MSTIRVDVLLHIYSTAVRGSAVGAISSYTETPHPGTNKKIEGFKWDERAWPSDKELEALVFAPSIWDPTRNFLEDSHFQAGIGDNKDLLLLDIKEQVVENSELWIPEIQHGYFYIQDEEWYLYSDDLKIQQFHTNQTHLTLPYIDLRYKPKPGIPISVKQYKYDRNIGQYQPVLTLRKVTEFTGITIDEEEQETLDDDGALIVANINTSKEEFFVDYDFGSTPRIYLGKDYNDSVGEPIVLVGDIAPSGTLEALEELGIGDGFSNEYHTEFSPIDPSGVLEVWTWQNQLPQAWTEINPLDDFTEGASKEFKVDYVLGIVEFGNYDPDTTSGAGSIPSTGHKIGITYVKGIEAEYEPFQSRDYLLAKTADVNPLHNSTHRGFIKLSTVALDPAAVTLTANLEGEDDVFDIDAGNSVGDIIATVTDKNGNTVESHEVFFEILDPVVGSFGTLGDTTSALTNAEGEATVFFNPPVSIADMGRATISVIHDGGDTVMTVSGLIEPENPSGVFLFQVKDSDPVLGIPEEDEAEFYTEFLSDEEIEGSTANKDYEEDRRITEELLRPVTYTSNDITTGAKVIVIGIDNNATHPHSGVQYSGRVYAPIVPRLTSNVGTAEQPDLELTYTSNLPLPGTEDIKSYFVVSNAQTSIRAYIINPRTNKKIYSNKIYLNVQIPDEANGVLIAETLSDIEDGLLTKARNVDDMTDGQIALYSGDLHELWVEDHYPSGESYVDWFRRTRRGDTDLLGLPEVLFSGFMTTRIPLGFRLKSSGITIASMLDAVTFLDINDHLPSGYFE